MGGRVHLGRFLGVPIVAGVSWFLWLFVMVFLLTGFFAPAGAPVDGRAFGMAVIVVLIYVLALLGHEFGHALMGRRLGIETQAVELWMLGGLAHLSRPARTPKEEFLIAAAGPAVTFVVAVSMTDARRGAGRTTGAAVPRRATSAGDGTTPSSVRTTSR